LEKLEIVKGNKFKLLNIGIYLAVFITAGYLIYKIWGVSVSYDDLREDVSWNQFQGPPDAEKVIVEFVDYRCSYCRSIHEILVKVLERNPDVKIVYRHLPAFGRPSLIDAEVALAAGKYGKFEQAHNHLISREKPITDEEIEVLAYSMDIDYEEFKIEMKSPEMGMFLFKTIRYADLLGIDRTPTFIIGDILYSGDMIDPSVETFENLLKQAYGE